MSMHPQPAAPVPEDTARVARAAFPKGNLYMKIRDELGTIYEDQQFAALFPTRGQPAEAPWRLALVCVFQFIEGLSDRQAADAVRSRIDWKYALGLELTDPGFDFSVLSEFRARLISGGCEELLLDAMLAQFKQRGWIKERGSQRTDSTHVLAAVRVLNRLEMVGETLRAALNALTVAAPDWLQEQVEPEWFEVYGRQVEEYRLPKGQQARYKYAATVGADGSRLLNALYSHQAPGWLRDIPLVQVLRRVWVQQYMVIKGQIQLRPAQDLPPAGARIDSPYDPQASYGNKRSTTWTGYKVHVTETCGRDPDEVHLITNVETTQAHIADADLTAPIHKRLATKELLPDEHLLDAGYVDADLLVSSQRDYGIEVIGPVRPNVSWQAKAAEPGEAYDVSAFNIDWDGKQVTCPKGRTNSSWTPHLDTWGNSVISIRFRRADCLKCPVRTSCTHSATAPRHMTFRTKADHQAIQATRQQQTMPEWQARYMQRAGVEGTLSQGIRAYELRETRYIGLRKAHLQHIMTAAGINIVRVGAW
ncbi:MAG: IS1182 family transposase, partial [Chloroflexota bacterium]|nr:IS1182 family transposase [Chloroflexota bacterium]